MPSHLRVTTAFAFTLVAALWSSASQTASQSPTAAYGVTDLGTIGGHQTMVRDIEPGGFPRIVGSGTTASGDEHAFEGNARGIRDLGTLGGRTSEALATLAGGRAVGRAQVASGAFHAFLADFNGMIDLGTLGGSSSYATSANINGVIVGASTLTGDANVRAFVYEDGTMTELPATLGGPDVVAHDINATRQIVGYADRASGQPHHAFLFDQETTIDLGSLGGTSEALAINDDGLVVGRSQLTNGVTHAFRHQNGVMLDIGTLGGGSSEALDVNREGAIVGWAETSAGERHAFIWRDGTMIDLNTLIPAGSGWTLEAATAIGNDDLGLQGPLPGAVVGYGHLNGETRSFFLTPPIDLAVSFQGHVNQLDTNVPNPHETGREIVWGVSIRNWRSAFSATGLTVTHTIGGPVEYLGARVDTSNAPFDGCVQTGNQIVCKLGSMDFDRSVFIHVRATSAGTITHSASVTADQPDPSPFDNSASESNTAVSLQSLTLTPPIVTGGQLSLGRVTLTSPTPAGGSVIPVTSSRPDLAPVPSEFGVQPDANGGLFREFNIVTAAVATPVTVDIAATYGLVTQTVPLTIMPAGSQWPLADSARQIPGTIQAEDFDEGGEGAAYHDAGRGNDGNAYRSADVDIEPTGDAGGGYNVGWISGGEWLEYTTNVAKTGSYTMDARVASPGPGGTFHLAVDGVDKTGPITVPDTGGWQSWITLSRSVTLESGLHVVRVSFDSNGANGAFGNMNYLRFVATGPGGSIPFGGTPRSIPGTVQAEDFDEGGDGVGYHDADPSNLGGWYRPAGVDVEPTTDLANGYDVGWMTAGEWLTYTVSVPRSGTYTLTSRVAADGAGGTFHVEFGGANKTASLHIPDTGGWQNWVDVTSTVTLTGGTQSMRFVADQNGPAGVFGNLNYIRLSAVATAPADVVIDSSDLTLHGAWFPAADGTAASGEKVLTPDVGVGPVSAPLASPIDYVDATFDAQENIPYRIWLRLRATGDTKFSESVWVQFSDARTAGGSVYPIGSTSGLLVNLESCFGCGVSGWGWQSGAYWLEQPTTVSFGTAGPHVLRIQAREDGAQIDQIVLSPSRYVARAPGALKNDTMIVSK